MPIRLPDGLNDLNFLVGSDFPEADEDALWRCAHSWSAAAAALRQLHPDVAAAGARVLQAMAGESGASFARAWAVYADTPEGFIERLAEACEQLASACDRAAVEVEYAKIQYIAALVILGATIAALVATIWAGGVSAAGIPIAVAAAQLTIRLVLMRLLTAVVLGAGVNVAIDLVAQSIQLTQHHRDGWDVSRTVRAAEDGAIFGAIGGTVFLAGGRLAPGFMGSPAGLAVGAGLTGGLGGLAAPLAHGEVPTGREVLLSLTAGVVGGLGPDLARGRVGGPDLGNELVNGPDLSGLATLDPDRYGTAVGPAHDGPVGRPPSAEAPPSTSVEPGSRAVDRHRPDAPELAGTAAPDRSAVAGDGPATPPRDATYAGSPQRAEAARIGAVHGTGIAPGVVGHPGAANQTASQAGIVNQPVTIGGPGSGPAGPSTPAGSALSGSPGTAAGVVATHPPVGYPVNPPAGAATSSQAAALASPPAGAATSPLPGTAAAPPAASPPSGPGTSGLTNAPGTGPIGGDGAAAIGTYTAAQADHAHAGHGESDLSPARADLTDEQAIELVRAHAFTTDAGLAFYAADDDVRDFARAVRPTEGFVTLDLHGSTKGFRIDDQLLTPGQFAAALRTLQTDGVLVLPEGHGIKLLSCDTATGGSESPAAKLARALNVEVIAPDLPVWTTMDGEEVVASPVLVDGDFLPADPPDGGWHRFAPNGRDVEYTPSEPISRDGDGSDRHDNDHAPRGPDPHGAASDYVVGEGADARLIGADQAIVDDRKVTAYALNPDHPVGRNKARVFSSVLGFDSSNAESLMSQIRAGVATNPPMPGIGDRFGQRFTVDVFVTGPNGSAIVRTGWIFDPGATVPRLTTLYVRP